MRVFFTFAGWCIIVTMPVWVSAATLTWDNGAVAALENPPLTPAGNGLWDTTSFNWAGSAWVNGSAASFTGPAAGTYDSSTATYGSYFTGTGSLVVPSVVPEPGTLVLLFTGLAFAGSSWRKRLASSRN